MGEDRTGEAAFADAALRTLPGVAVPRELEDRILADFDRIARRRAPGALRRLLDRWRDAVWPGAPLWKPASVLVLSLLIGLTTGALVPSVDLSSSSSSSSDQVAAAADDATGLDLSEGL